MSHYTADLRDLEFNLFEFLETKDQFGTGPFEQMDADTARGVLAEVRRLAEGPLAASFADADRHPPVFDPATSSVTVPESFRRSVRAVEDGEWYRLDLPEHLGGFGAPHALSWAAFEMVLGANPAVFMYGSWAAFAAILHELGTADQKRLAELMIERKWGATMVLTEPDAGSDVGAGRTKAVRQPDGSWHLTGVKRFITSAEHDLSDNIVHLVLARPEGAGPGTKGLSLFVVPKFHVDLETGALGERNGVYVTNVEKKMGLKVSTTCELTFGDGPVPARGWLVGEVHDGIAQMFRVIEHARMFVGAKAIATLSAGYQVALDYAKNRVQGADLTATSKDAPRVPITHHPDVRRSLMLQKSYAEGMRALYLYAASFRDQVTQADAEGKGDSEEATLAERVNDLLLPVVGQGRLPRSGDGAALPDPLAGAVRPGDGGGARLRHPGRRTASRLDARGRRARHYRLPGRGRGRPRARHPTAPGAGPGHVPDRGRTAALAARDGGARRAGLPPICDPPAAPRPARPRGRGAGRPPGGPTRSPDGGGLQS